MKIDFIDSKQDLKVGSYRIWIHDSVSELKLLGHNVEVHSNLEECRDDSVLVYSKGDYTSYQRLPSRIAGVINPSRDARALRNFDFAIVGSIEEKLSIQSQCKNVFVVNLIESMYKNCAPKVHQEASELVIGYHGSHTHLGKLATQGFFEAFKQRINEGKKYKIVTLTSRPDMARNVLTENGVPWDLQKNFPWTFETAQNVIKTFDVGIVPNATNALYIWPDSVKSVTNSILGLYETDYLFRFKNKSNAGRIFVLVQMGIPVIADLTPSNMPMLFDEKCGSVIFDQASFYKALDRFDSPDERNKTAQLAKKRFDQLYNKKDDLQSMMNSLPQLTKTKLEKQ